MKYGNNIEAVAKLNPDYLGFIFYEKSSRFFDSHIPTIPGSIKKVGVFVDANIDYVSEMIKKYHLNAVQLHGNESPEYCSKLQTSGLEIIKVFSVLDEFDFSILKYYEDVCDYFLFDTKGKLPGGNGYTFNWDILKAYPSKKPFFLSGGIGLDQIEHIKAFKRSEVSKYCYAIDVNSKFESESGLKKINELEQIKKELSLC